MPIFIFVVVRRMMCVNKSITNNLSCVMRTPHTYLYMQFMHFIMFHILFTRSPANAVQFIDNYRCVSWAEHDDVCYSCARVACANPCIIRCGSPIRGTTILEHIFTCSLRALTLIKCERKMRARVHINIAHFANLNAEK